ncbi:hypothetical protein E2986_13673, partial [Frieseomelitta varia]
ERLREFVRDERRLTSPSWQTGERRSRVAASDENSNSTSPGSANKRRKDSCRSAHGPEARQSSRNHRTVNFVRRPFITTITIVRTVCAFSFGVTGRTTTG